MGSVWTNGPACHWKAWNLSPTGIPERTRLHDSIHMTAVFNRTYGVPRNPSYGINDSSGLRHYDDCPNRAKQLRTRWTIRSSCVTRWSR